MSSGPGQMLMFLSGGADLIAFAVLGVLALWAVVTLRRSTGDLRRATGISMRPAPTARRRARAPAATPGPSPRRRLASLTLASAFLFSASSYIGVRSIPHAFQFLELRDQRLRGALVLTGARWTEPQWRCAPDIPLGVHLARLLAEHRMFILRITWDAGAPAYEFAVVGPARLAEAAPLRRIDMTIAVSLDGEATLRRMEINEEAQGIGPAEPGAKLLQAACQPSRR